MLGFFCTHMTSYMQFETRCAILIFNVLSIHALEARELETWMQKAYSSPAGRGVRPSKQLQQTDAQLGGDHFMDET